MSRFLLESVENGERWSRFSFIGRDPVATLVLRGEALDIEGTLGAMVPTDRDPRGVRGSSRLAFESRYLRPSSGAWWHRWLSRI